MGALKAAVAAVAGVLGAAVASAAPAPTDPTVAEAPPAVQEDPWGFFSSWKAPRKKRSEVEEAIARAHEKAAAVGVSPEKFHFKLDEALAAWSWTDSFKAPSRAALSDPDNPERGEAQRSGLLQALRTLRSAFVKNGHVPVICETIEEIAHALGVEVRQARTIMAQAEIAKAITVIRRYADEDHIHATAESPSAECRLNIVVFDGLPAWDHYEKGRTRRDSGQRPISEQASKKQRAAQPKRSPSPSVPLDPAADPTYLELATVFAAAHEAKYRPELESRGEQYDPQTAGSIAAKHHAAVGTALRNFAHQARERALAKGRSDLTIDTIRAEVIHRVVEAFLDKTKEECVKRRHPLGFLWNLGGKDRNVRDLLVLGQAAVNEWDAALEPGWDAALEPEWPTELAAEDATLEGASVDASREQITDEREQIAGDAAETNGAESAVEPAAAEVVDDINRSQTPAAGETPAQQARAEELRDCIAGLRARLGIENAVSSAAPRLSQSASLDDRTPAPAGTAQRRRDPVRVNRFVSPPAAAPEPQVVIAGARGPPRPR
jgi:hypothetical protein